MIVPDETYQTRDVYSSSFGIKASVELVSKLWVDFPSCSSIACSCIRSEPCSEEHCSGFSLFLLGLLPVFLAIMYCIDLIQFVASNVVFVDDPEFLLFQF
ncbi:unnamed protein product [Citrullus colocynthis]|uniref:Uncharacterized protein n=1 Tax=Citrullus colocynthis TaxID=252529 RepID=A0ABP0Z5M0_9ROSI